MNDLWIFFPFCVSVTLSTELFSFFVVVFFLCSLFSTGLVSLFYKHNMKLKYDLIYCVHLKECLPYVLCL